MCHTELRPQIKAHYGNACMTRSAYNGTMSPMRLERITPVARAKRAHACVATLKTYALDVIAKTVAADTGERTRRRFPLDVASGKALSSVRDFS